MFLDFIDACGYNDFEDEGKVRVFYMVFMFFIRLLIVFVERYSFVVV